MYKLDINATARAWRTETKALSRDEEGREILIGLSYEDSVWMVDYQKRWLMTDRDDFSEEGDKERYLALHARHERARLIELGRSLIGRGRPR
jgi:hypothetical protein